MSFFFGNRSIESAKRYFRAKAREWTPETHRAKDDMPTMGGIFILLVVLINSLLWCDLGKPQVWIFMGCLVGFGGIGFWDDWYKIKYRKGISALLKFVLQWSVAFLVAYSWSRCYDASTTISFPFFKNFNPDIGMFYIPWVMFILVSMSNAVNLTDGLDGLAIGSLLPNFATFSLIAYLAGHYLLSCYLAIPFAGSAELTVIGMILFGAALAFLWYNTYPAQIFMGDVGSLSLGSGLALLAVMTKQELLLPLAGGLFVVEVLSVMAQVYSFRFLGKRVLKMAPLHHHFELLGWQESKITVRFGIISLILCLLAIITLKIR